MMSEVSIAELQDRMVLPARYYLAHFQTILSGCEALYSPILGDEEKKFIQSFKALSDNAKCLYVRLANRKRIWFRLSKLKYPELIIKDAVAELIGFGFITLCNPVPCTIEWLELYSLRELRALFPSIRGYGSRAELLNLLEHTNGYDSTVLNEAPGVVRQERCDVVQYLQFLFFGTGSLDHTEFVLRDLNLRKYQPIDPEALEPKFQTKEEANFCYRLTRAGIESEVLIAERNSEDVMNWAVTILDDPSSVTSEVADHYRARFVAIVGAFFERIRRYDLALEIYRHATSEHIRHRMVRTFVRTGQIDTARMLCSAMQRQPGSDAEEYFARAQLARIEQRSKRLDKTQLLRDSEVVILDSAWRNQVEKGVINHFETLGYEAWHCENRPWQDLFGLTFWDIVYDPEVCSPHSIFQRAPRDLRDRSFFDARRDRIFSKLEGIQSVEDWIEDIHRTCELHMDESNAFVLWRENLVDETTKVLKLVGAKAAGHILVHLARNPAHHRSGFPDILVSKAADYEFLEIKSPNDALSYQQFAWLTRMRSIGIPARVLRVEWS